MSRTEQFTLPRIPTTHARVTSPRALTHHTARTMRSGHRSTQTEPSYTAYIGTPRQDLPVHVFRDAAMYEGVFDREGRFSRRTTPKYHAPLDTLDYNGLHDPHCRRLYLNNKHLREHLVNLGLLTEDLKVVASTKEQRQRIRAHEMLEKKEQLMETMEDRERRRLSNMMNSSKLPHIARWSKLKEADRQALAERRTQQLRQKVEQTTEDRLQPLHARSLLQAASTDQEEVKLQQKLKWEKFVKEHELQQQRERNAEKLVQKDADMVKYINRFGMSEFGLELASWHYDSHVIGQRMWAMEQLHWKKTRPDHLPPPSSDADSEDREREREREREIERGYLRQVEETARQLRQSKEKTNDSIQQEEDTGFELKRALEPEDETEGKTADGAVIADALLAVVGDGFTVHWKEGEGEEETDLPSAAPDNEKREDGGQEQETGPLPPSFHSPHTQQDVPVVAGEVAHAGEGEGLARQTADRVVAPQSSVQRPSSEQSRQLLAEFVIMLAASADPSQMGYATANDFVQLLGSHEVGLKLTDDELYQIVSFLDPDGSGWVPYFESSTAMREVLLALYSARAVETKPSNADSEEAWLPMYTPTFGYLYFNSVDGQAQRERPAVFRPYLADDVFEDTIVDFFETADVKGDHLLDEEEFREFLFSPSVTEQLYEEQKEDLIGLFSASTSDHMTLEEFVPLARTMITMVYRRHYEGQSTDEWLELNSNKFGAFWLNKNTGETLFPQEMEVVQSPGSIPSTGFAHQFSNQFGADELPTLGEFTTTAHPSSYHYAHAMVPQAVPMMYHTLAPPPASHQGERTKKRRLKKKQKSSSAQEGEGNRPPPLRPRTKEQGEQRTAEGSSQPLDGKQTDGVEPLTKNESGL